MVSRSLDRTAKVSGGEQLSHSWRTSWMADFAPVVIAPSAFALWLSGLQHVNLLQMTDLGIVSILPPLCEVAMAVVVGCFVLELGRPRLRYAILLLQLVLLVVMLDGVTAIIEQAPRLSATYTHVGLTEYIMRTGTINPDAQTYYSWPAFFILITLVLQTLVPAALRLSLLLSLVNWAPVLFNLLYMGPLYLIMSALTRDKRIVWLGLGLFILTNWVAQDYFSPQGFAYFLYLIILAVSLMWFKPLPLRTPADPAKINLLRRLPLLSKELAWLMMPSDAAAMQSAYLVTPRQRAALLKLILAVFALAVASHPITPIFIIISMTILAYYRRSLPLRLPILMLVMFGLWFAIMGRPFWEGHMSMVVGNLGSLSSAYSQNVSVRANAGSAEHQFVVRMCMVLSVLVWGLAGLGALLRLLQGHRDVPYILLAIAPLGLVPIQPYGGEMLLRAYLFGLPFMLFFVASLFCSGAALADSLLFAGRTAALALVLLSCCLIARYGNERENFITPNEVAAVAYLYHAAPHGSLLIEAASDAPWGYEYQDLYTYESMYVLAGLDEGLPVDPAKLSANYMNLLLQAIEGEGHGRGFVLFTRNQEVYSSLQTSLPAGTLSQLELRLLSSDQFRMIYSNPEAQILEYTGPRTAANQGVNQGANQGANQNASQNHGIRRSASSIPR